MGLSGAEVFDEFDSAYAVQIQIECHEFGFPADIGDAGVEAVVHLHHIESHFAEDPLDRIGRGFVFVDH